LPFCPAEAVKLKVVEFKDAGGRNVAEEDHRMRLVSIK